MIGWLAQAAVVAEEAVIASELPRIASDPYLHQSYYVAALAVVWGGLIVYAGWLWLQLRAHE